MASIAHITPTDELIEYFEDFADYQQSNAQPEARAALATALATLLQDANGAVNRTDVARWINAHVEQRIEIDKKVWTEAGSVLERRGTAQRHGDTLAPARVDAASGRRPSSLDTTRQPNPAPEPTLATRFPGSGTRSNAPDPIPTSATRATRLPTQAATQATLFPAPRLGTHQTHTVTQATLTITAPPL